MGHGSNGGHWPPGGPRPPGARRPLMWRGLLLVGAVLVLGSGFRLAEPALDAVRGDSRSDATADLPPIPPIPPPPSTAPAGTGTALPQRPVVVISEPTRLRVPRLSIDAPITHIGLNADGSIGVPTAWGDVGWFDRGPAPGGIGPAVLVGHYDSTTGPAVFYRLPQVVAGDRVEVAGPTGATQAFIVDRSEEVTKATFPADRVYGPVARPELRLITCGGAFDHKTHHYLSNLIVYAHADTSAPPVPGANVPGAAPGQAAPAQPLPRPPGAASPRVTPRPPATSAPGVAPLPQATSAPGVAPLPPATSAAAVTPLATVAPRRA
ncbi:putative secreted protein (Partial match) [Frankia canadensis]|uniref:Putative secreted protein (Partial match) n=1 Tax=Frankia canadensis TaxID=1836972 RepID=A0A2I2KIQ8_9ACTN|nr:class F sortase [Frankia canadensis]SNQ45550.1 putative secreted protein (Partial match) [Frankia canadensis]SOU52840.1 putative secreted protein (Partial match) [Frankia canadensis]